MSEKRKIFWILKAEFWTFKAWNVVYLAKDGLKEFILWYELNLHNSGLYVRTSNFLVRTLKMSNNYTRIGKEKQSLLAKYHYWLINDYIKLFDKKYILKFFFNDL